MNINSYLTRPTCRTSTYYANFVAHIKFIIINYKIASLSNTDYTTTAIYILLKYLFIQLLFKRRKKLTSINNIKFEINLVKSNKLTSEINLVKR